MRSLKVKITDCSEEKLIRIAIRCGFKIVGGRKHCKVKTHNGDKFITEIPRKNRIKRETAKGIVEDFNKFGGNVEIS